MSKVAKCPACQNEIDAAACICSNPQCRTDLAVCAYCRDVTTYTPVDTNRGRFLRDTYRCARCHNVGVKCLTWVRGGYCNAFAKPGKTIDQPFCPQCSNKAGDAARTILSWSVIGIFGNIIRRK